MNILERKVENQVHFWSLIGPGIILLAIAVLLFKSSSHWYFPLSAVVGIPLCLKWRMKGMAIALAFLCTLFIASYSHLEMEERVWHIGMGMAMASSFVILALSLEEVGSLISRIQAESQSRLDNFLNLDEKMKNLESEWEGEKGTLSTKIQSLSKDLTQLQEDKQTFHKLVNLAKEELIGLRQQHEQLLQDLFFKKQQIAQLNERLEESEVTIQSFINTDAEQKIQDLTAQLNQAETQIGCLTRAQEELKEQNQAAQQQIEQQEYHLTASQSEIGKQEKMLAQLSEEKQQLISSLNSLQREYDSILNSENILRQESKKYELQITQTNELIKQKEEQFNQQQAAFELQIKENQEHLELLKYSQAQQAEQDKQAYEKRLLESRQELEQLRIALSKQNAQIESVNELIKQKEALLNEQKSSYELKLQELKEQIEANISQAIYTQQEKLVYEKGLLESRQEMEQLRTTLAKQQEQIESINALLKQKETLLDEQETIYELKLQEVNEQLEQAKISQAAQTEQEKLAYEKYLQELKQETEQLQFKLLQSTRDLQEQTKKLHDVQIQMQQFQQILKQVEQQRTDLEQQLEQSVKIFEEQKVKLKETNEKLHEYPSQIKVLEERCIHFEKECASLKEKLAKPNISPVVNGNQRRLESMYQQLKEQFQEKTAVLDTTRRELFLMQEEYLALQKDKEEKERYQISETEQLFQKELQKLAKESEKIQVAQQQEIESLHQLVGDLFKKMS